MIADLVPTTRPPGPSTHGPLGALPELRRDPLRLFGRLAREHGPVAAFRLGPKPAVVLSGPDAIREVLVSHAEDFDKGDIQRRAFTPALRNGLLIAEGDLHRVQRKLLVPHFQARRIAGYVDLFAREAHRHAERLQDGQEVDLLSVMGAITRDVIGYLLWGRSLEEESELAAAVTRVFEWEMRALFAVLPVPLSVPTPSNRQMTSDLSWVRGRIQSIVDARRAEGSEHPDLLDALLQARYEDGAPMSDDQLLDELITLWGAAHETSADAQFWTAMLLSTHPEIGAQVAEEADRVLGDRLPTAEDLIRLPYALATFKESMRLYPPAASLLRAAVRDTTIAGYRISRGTIVFISTYAMHRDPSLYPDPETFDPRRFLSHGGDRGATASAAERNRFGYLPFGAGKHVCIGSTLALTEGQVFTAVLARRLRFELCEPGPVEPQLLINLRPRGTVRAIVARRTPPVSKEPS